MAAVTLSASVNYTNNGMAIVTNSSGYIYIFGVDPAGSTGLHIWKSTDSGASFNELTAVTNLTISGNASYYPESMDAGIDTNNKVHVVCFCNNKSATRDIAYALLDTSNDSWSAWEQAAARSGDGYGNYPSIALSIDSNSKPHVVYMEIYSSMGNDYTKIMYTNKTGASWAAPTQLNTTTGTCLYPGIMVRDNNYIETVWTLSTVGTKKRTYTTSWGSEANEKTGGAVTSGKDWLTAHTDGTVYYYDYDSDLDILYENNTNIGTMTGYFGGTTGAAALAGTHRVIFYVSTSYSLKMAWWNGSWTTTTLIAATTDYTLQTTCEWAYNFENQTNRVNYVYGYGSKTYYNYHSLNVYITPAVSTYKQKVLVQPSIPIVINSPATYKFSGFIQAQTANVGFARFYKSASTDVAVSASTLAATPQTLTLVPGAKSIEVNVGSLSSIPQAITLSMGAVTIPINVSSLAASPPSITFSMGGITITINGSSIQAQPRPIIVDAGVSEAVFVDVDTISINSAAQGLTLIPGAFTLVLNVSNLTTTAQTITVVSGASTALLNVSSISAIPGTVTMSLGGVTVDFSASILNAQANNIVVISDVLFEIASALLSTQTDDVLSGSFFGVLKYWDGNNWVYKPLKVYSGGVWTDKPLKIYLDDEWKLVRS